MASLNVIRLLILLKLCMSSEGRHIYEENSDTEKLLIHRRKESSFSKKSDDIDFVKKRKRRDVENIEIEFPYGIPDSEFNGTDVWLFGGDMLLTPTQKRQVESGGDISLTTRRKRRGAISEKLLGKYLWFATNKTIPYIFHPSLDLKAEATFALMSGLREFEERSCLKFVKRTDQQDYIRFIAGSGCHSNVGRQGGAQSITLAAGCWRRSTVVHEIAHAIGFTHEQNRPDRDEYVTVVWDNILEGRYFDFQKFINGLIDSLNSPYDYSSVMQYYDRAFSINGSKTLIAKQKNITQLGQEVGFTKIDQEQAMAFYRCNGTTTRETPVYTRHVLTGKNDCDFENGLCGFVQDSSDDFDWTRVFGTTSSLKTGPESDHTTKRLGHFVYIEASHPQKQNDTARFISKVFTATTKKICFSFFYHMFAKDEYQMGSLNVYLSDSDNSRKLLMNRNISAGSDWIEARFTLKPLGQYQVIFEGIRGRGYQSDIAIDDISFKSRNCNTIKTKKRNVQCGLKKKEPCENINDREAEYCSQWKADNYCTSYKTIMKRFCAKTCKFCT